MDDYSELMADLQRMSDEMVQTLVTESVIEVKAPTVKVDMSGINEAFAKMADAIALLAREVSAMKAAQPPVTVNVDNVRVTSMPDRVHSVLRDGTGKPTGSVESDA